MALIHQIIETSLYVRDLEEAERFYQRVFDLPTYSRVPGRHVFFKIGTDMLLLFNPEASRKPGSVPTHGAEGAGHAAFAIQHEELEFWKNRLTELGVAIEHEHEWPGGGRSLYFRDPSGNSIELVTPDTWPDRV